MSKVGKTIEAESRLVVARDWEEEEVNANGYGTSFWNDENVLGIGSVGVV